MEIALIGYTADDPNDPYTLVPPTWVEHRFLDGPVAKDRREDLQIWGALQALTLRGALLHPVSIQPGADPPDRLISAGNKTFATELTELTLEDLRGRLARVRKVGRAVADELALAENAPKYAHLAGRQVVIADTAIDKAHYPEVRLTVDRITAVLSEDRGYIGEGLDLSAGLPAHIGARGTYGEISGLTVHVQLHEPPAGVEGTETVAVVASAQSDFRLSEARSLFWSRVTDKDDPRNRILIASTGLVDSGGYICPLDQWLFMALHEHGVGQPLSAPQHLDAVVLHRFGSHEVFVAYERPGASLPWGK